MKLIINEQFSIKTDAHNYILVENVKGKRGVTQHNRGYFRTLEPLYNKLVELAIMDSGLEDVKELIVYLKDLHAAINNTLKEGFVYEDSSC